MTSDDPQSAAAAHPRRIYVYNGGFLRRHIRAILQAAGYSIHLGRPTGDDLVAVWGHSPTSHRGTAVATRTGASLLRIEDAFLRSVKTGRDGDPPLGLCIDTSGVHFDGSVPSDLEKLLLTDPLDHSTELAEARALIARIRRLHLSKYNLHDPNTAPPDPGYVLVIDQTYGDASLRCCGANHARFQEMLTQARIDHPGQRILIKTHPETAQGHRKGHFSDAELLDESVTLYSGNCSPWDLLEGAVAVYTVSSQLGFEAILAGHKPTVFGQPFYAGWGLTHDEMPLPRRERNLTAAQLFLGAMMKYPVWFDPYTNQTCNLSRIVDTLEALTRAYRDDRTGWNAHGIRLWKRAHFQHFFGTEKPVKFRSQSNARRTMVWASSHAVEQVAQPATKVEDGFLRSVGLGAQLVPPLSLVLDDLGIYYDPSAPSQLEEWIAARSKLTEDQRSRAHALRASICAARLSKYNLSASGSFPPNTGRKRILVPGQVEDDASIRKGTSSVSTNIDLLRVTREANPEAEIWYKPHPDVEAALRTGAVPDAQAFADHILTDTDPIAAIGAVDAVWTMTSLLGFEALLHNLPVTCLGQPFYAGWGLTTDLGPKVGRRTAKPTLDGLVHAALIDYPRYLDPVTGKPCPVEVAVMRLGEGRTFTRPLGLKALAKLQGAFATYAWLWR